MSIPHKKGICIDCGPDSEKKYLISTRCISYPFHYQKYQKEKYMQKKFNQVKVKTAAVASSNNGQTIGKWFNEQISILPNNCENCGDYLNPNAIWSARAYVAHIVPKRYFLSVQVHPLNRLFLCIDCHAKFDNSLSKEIELMKVYPLAVERFSKFSSQIAPDEIKHLAPCLEKVFYAS